MVFYGTGGKLATYYHPLYGLGILPLILTSLLSVGLHSYLLPCPTKGSMQNDTLMKIRRQYHIHL
jgi:hypothetical protein